MTVVINGTTGIDTGTGSLVAADSTTATYLDMFEDTDNGSNYVRLIAPASITANRTVTLPNNTGTLLSTASTGTVLQVVQTSKTDTATISMGTSNVDIPGMSVSITPSSASNRILVMGQVLFSLTLSDIPGLVLVRGSTPVGVGDANGNRNRNTSGQFTGTGATNNATTIPVIFLDSPATTSSITYKLQLSRLTSGTATYYLNRNARYDNFTYDGTYMSSIIVMEVAG